MGHADHNMIYLRIKKSQTERREERAAKSLYQNRKKETKERLYLRPETGKKNEEEEREKEEILPNKRRKMLRNGSWYCLS